MLDYLRTNIDLYECLDLAYTVFKFSSLVTEQLSIPVPELSEDVKIDGIGWVISMDRYENAEILNDFIFNDYLPDFILNRSTEKDPSIYFEYDGFGSSYDESYYYEECYYEEDYYTPEIYEPIEEEVIQPEEPSEDIVPTVNESNTGEGTITDDGSNQGEDLGNSDNFDNNQMSPEGEAP